MLEETGIFLTFYLLSAFLIKENKPLISAAISIGTLTVVLCSCLVRGEIYSLYWFPLIPLLAGMLFDFKVFLFFTYAPIFIISSIFCFQIFTDSHILFTINTYRTGFNAFSAYLFFATTAVIYKFFMEKYKEKLKSFLERDYLTGVLTRRALFSHLELLNCRKTPYSVIMVDIDNFKKINDTFGHQAGDTVLKELGKLFKENLRRSDFVGRYGGEEFLIVLPETEKKKAVTVAEKLRQTVEETFFSFPGKRLTVSLGVAYCSEADTFEKTIKLADERLYKAKKLGKNRVASK